MPAFGGLGAPWWDAAAVGIVSGVTFGVTRAPLARAALDSIAHQIADVLDAVRMSGASVDRLLVDGGPTRNDQLMQFEADMVAVPVERTDVAELSAMGVAHLAGVSAGLFTFDGLRRLNRGGQAFRPSRAPQDRLARARRLGARGRAVARYGDSLNCEADEFTAETPMARIATVEAIGRPARKPFSRRERAGVRGPRRLSAMSEGKTFLYSRRQMFYICSIRCSAGERLLSGPAQAAPSIAVPIRPVGGARCCGRQPGKVREVFF